MNKIRPTWFNVQEAVLKAFHQTLGMLRAKSPTLRLSTVVGELKHRFQNNVSELSGTRSVAPQGITGLGGAMSCLDK
jgi:hypothetical protein